MEKIHKIFFPLCFFKTEWIEKKRKCNSIDEFFSMVWWTALRAAGIHQGPCRIYILNINLVVISTFHSPKALVRRSSGRRISPRSLNHDCVILFILLDTNDEINYFLPIVVLRSNSHLRKNAFVVTPRGTTVRSLFPRSSENT